MKLIVNRPKLIVIALELLVPSVMPTRTYTILTLAVLFYAAMGLALSGCVAPNPATSGQVATAGGIAGIKADNETAQRLNAAAIPHADPTGKELLGQQGEVLVGQSKKADATDKANQQQNIEYGKMKTRAETAEGNQASASRLRYDIFAGICVAVAVGATVLRAYFPPVNTFGGESLKNLTTACAVAATGFVIASIASGAVAQAMIYIGPAMGIALVILAVFWSMAHRKVWATQKQTQVELVQTVQTIKPRLSPTENDNLFRYGGEIDRVQSNATRAVVAKIKPTLPPPGDPPTDPPTPGAEPATGATA